MFNSRPQKTSEWSPPVPAVNSNRPILAELFFRLLNVTDELDEPFTGARNALLRPVGELELAHDARLTILQSVRRNMKILRDKRN